MKNKIGAMLVCATALTLTIFAEQPDKWVSYVESQGSAWVDTGITGRWNTKIEAKVEWMNLSDSAFVSCGDWQNNTRFYPCYCLDNLGKIIVSQGTNVIVMSPARSRPTAIRQSPLDLTGPCCSATNMPSDLAKASFCAQKLKCAMGTRAAPHQISICSAVVQNADIWLPQLISMWI